MKKLDTREEWTDPFGYTNRYQAAVRLGVSEPLASDFAESLIPVWKLRDLIEHGCKPDLALEILT